MNQRTLGVVVLVILGLLALAVGVIYLTVEAKSLPSILGQISGSTVHRSKRGVAALVVGGLLLVAGIGLFVYKPPATDSAA
jgi:amino acid permease